VIVGTVVALTFLFAFGNVATLGIRLGVPTYVAFLVAPAVDLLHRARPEDVLHRQIHHRPISAANLRKRLHVGAGTAHSLVTQLRSDTKATLDASTPGAAVSRTV
jgi:hypothetical protein